VRAAFSGSHLVWGEKFRLDLHSEKKALWGFAGSSSLVKDIRRLTCLRDPEDQDSTLARILLRRSGPIKAPRAGPRSENDNSGMPSD